MHKKSRLQRRRKNDPTVDCPNHIDLRAPRAEEWELDDPNCHYGGACDPFLIEKATIDGKLQTDQEWFEEDQLNMELEGTLEVVG